MIFFYYYIFKMNIYLILHNQDEKPTISGLDSEVTSVWKYFTATEQKHLIRQMQCYWGKEWIGDDLMYKLFSTSLLVTEKSMSVGDLGFSYIKWW